MVRRLLVVASVLAAAGIVVVVVDPFAGGGRGNGGVLDNGYPPSLATVTRGSLSSQTEVGGTLGYAAKPDGTLYQVIDQASGTLTALPSTGRVVGCGRVLYRVTDSPVPAVRWRHPRAWRQCSPALGQGGGYTVGAGWRRNPPETVGAVQAAQTRSTEL